MLPNSDGPSNDEGTAKISDVRGALAAVTSSLAGVDSVFGSPDRKAGNPSPDGGVPADACKCQSSIERPQGTGITDRRELVVDATACPGDGDLAAAPACRSTVISALADRDADVVRTRSDGRERTYAEESMGLLLAAGRFVERVGFHDDSLAERARRDPVAAAHRATGRAGAVARIAAETGLTEGAARVVGEATATGKTDSTPTGGDASVDHLPPGNEDASVGRPSPRNEDASVSHLSSKDSDASVDYDDVLRAYVGPTLSRCRVSRRPPDAPIRETRDLETGATVRIVEATDGPRYHLAPVAHELDADATATLAAAYDVLANGSVGGGDRAAGRAIRRVADTDDPMETLTAVLERHTRGLGVLEHLFADARVSEVVVSAPVTDSPVRVVIDGDRVPTNVRLTPDGAASLASRFRRESGRAFSRSSPTLDAAVVAETGRQIRVASVTAPASDGVGFAFRVRDETAFTLARLVAVGSLSPAAAGFLSLVVQRGAATIVAGTRGAGKTTLLGALLWELPESTRLVSIEDTPELPIEALREHGRDVQALHTDVGEGIEAADSAAGDGRAFSPTDALRTALRLGDGALAIGEVRGEEAAALYEAMRIGAHGHAVLGTIHGDSAAAVRERVVSDLGVPPASFAATDIVVTCAHDGDSRHVAAIEEVRSTDDGTTFVPLYERENAKLHPTGVVARGDSAVLERLRASGESYGDLLSLLEGQRRRFERLASVGLTAPGDLDRSHSESR
ncbi:ATPase, T2SS/T4P/T4SS family [Halobellus marinus]|uniref:ATPase, T2SS/T4P/T4SS family n=1 Tax=Halobellus TaxID=1073986 RepID=UPI0028AD0BF9|nr:ATPase, T2SS/T4P/T4SS family [Halobellus sp. DFY28]